MKLLFIFFAVLLSVPQCTAQSQPAWSSAEQQIFTQLNQARTENGLPALEWNDQAAQAARLHTQTLLENGKLSHQFPGEPTVPERIGATGARFTFSAENVARTEYLEDVHPALMGSPGHRANILSPKYNAVGIGMVEKDHRIYVTQDFIFLIATYTEDQFAQAFAETLTTTRQSKGVKMLTTQPEKLLHDAACTTNGDSSKLPDDGPNAREIVAFTSSDPHQLPVELLVHVTNPQFRRMNFGVCFRPDQEHGYANFWVVATFAR